MLFLAGLMGLMAVGAVTFVETGSDEDDPDFDDANIAPSDNEFVMPDDPTLNTAVEEPELSQARAPSADEVADTNEVGDTTEADDIAPPSRGDPDTPGEIFTGDIGTDTVTGTEFDDALDGLGGTYLMNAGAGDDQVMGVDGNDTLNGEAGNDTLHGNAGTDLIYGGDGADSIYGDTDDDTLYGGDDDDTIYGGSEDDLLFGNDGADALHGGLDNDTIHGGGGLDTLFGGRGNDVIYGIEDPDGDGRITDTDGMDYLNGGAGDDLIIAGNDDYVSGGSGADDIVLGDWIAEGQNAHITDFDAEDDDLLFVWDDSGTDAEEPGVNIEFDGTTAQVMMDGQMIATVQNAPDLVLADIALIPLSSASAVGLAAT